MCKLLLLITVFSLGSLIGGPKEGIYVGLGGGAAFDYGKLTAVNVVNGFTEHRTLSTTHAVGNFLIGYGHTFKECFFVSLEGGTYFPSRSHAVERPGVLITTSTFTNKLKIQDYVTVDILPGFRLTKELLLFFRGGFTVAGISLTQDKNAAAGVPAFKESVTECGARVGVGANYGFFCNWSVGVDYFHTFYPKITAVLTGFSSTVSTKPNSDFIGISLQYNFPL